MNLALEVWHDVRVTRAPGLTCEDDEGAGTRGWQPGPTDVNGREITHQPRATVSKIFTPCLSLSHKYYKMLNFERDFISCFVI